MAIGKKGFQKGTVLFKGKDHPNWKGGKPKCNDCGVELSSYNAKVCIKCRGIRMVGKKMKCSNTGKTHFKKGNKPWNEGKKLVTTNAMKIAHEKRKGVSMPKPEGFSNTMRKVNPPLGRKIKNTSRNISKKLKVWRKGYILVYKPDYDGSRKSPPDYGYIAEHRYIIGLSIGRPLTSKEVVHHLDGDKSNNDIKNLVLCSNNRKHNQIHTSMQIFVEKLIREGKVIYDRKENEFMFA